MKLSVIIPVYNVENYLSKCLKSVLNQDFNDLEIICVNDGSTDNSLEILRYFENQYNNITVINKVNEGVSVARNIGLDIAKGEYIMFVDSDDYLEPNACRIAYEEITKNNADIGVFLHSEQDSLTIVEASINKKIRTYSEDKSLTDYTYFQVYIWDKIYRKSFLDTHNIRFPNDIRNAEDVIFNWCCMLNNPQYCFINQLLYVYLIDREGQATADYSNCIKNDIKALEKIHQIQIFKTQPKEVRLTFCDKFCNGSLNYWDYFYKFNERRVLIEDIKKLLQFIEENYEKEDLKQLKKYKKLKNIYLRTIINWIFSIMNVKTHKIITILGMRIRLKRKNAISC